MTKTLAVEWAPHGIRREHDLPRPDGDRGRGRRALADPGGPSPRRVVGARRPPGPVEEIALVDDRALLAPRPYITGANLTIDGGHWLEQEGYMPSLQPRG